MLYVFASFPRRRNAHLAWPSATVWVKPGTSRIQATTLWLKACNSHFFKLIRWEFVLNISSSFRPDTLSQTLHFLCRSSLRALSTDNIDSRNPSFRKTHFRRFQLIRAFVSRLKNDSACFTKPAPIYPEFWTRDHRQIVIKCFFRQEQVIWHLVNLIYTVYLPQRYGIDRGE